MFNSIFLFNYINSTFYGETIQNYLAWGLKNLLIMIKSVYILTLILFFVLLFCLIMNNVCFMTKYENKLAWTTETFYSFWNRIQLLTIFTCFILSSYLIIRSVLDNSNIENSINAFYILRWRLKRDWIIFFTPFLSYSFSSFYFF